MPGIVTAPVESGKQSGFDLRFWIGDWRLNAQFSIANHNSLSARSQFTNRAIPSSTETLGAYPSL
jgi:hypothetical protein